MTEHLTSAATSRDTLGITATTPDPHGSTVVLTGRLDAVEAPELRSALDRLIGGGARHLVIDLSAVSFVDSAGLAVLVRARRETRAMDGDVELVSPASDAAMRVFRLTQFDQVFTMLPARPPAAP